MTEDKEEKYVKILKSPYDGTPVYLPKNPIHNIFFRRRSEELMDIVKRMQEALETTDSGLVENRRRVNNVLPLIISTLDLNQRLLGQQNITTNRRNQNG